MTKEQANFLENASNYCGNQDIEVREDYSGRGMMGKTTFGVVVSSQSMLFVDTIVYIKENELKNDDIPDFNDFRTDNMGRDVILY